jgi:hypothetical protein
MAEKIGVFISHHHSEFEDTFTARLVADLEAAGADVWVDDVRITSDDFIKKINEGLSGRQWLVLVMTPESLRSPWVQTEVNAALNQVRKERMRGVIPLMAKPCADEDIPPLLDALHRYDATHGYVPACVGLLHALGLPVPGIPASTTSHPVPLLTPEPSPVHAPETSLTDFGQSDTPTMEERDLVESIQVPHPAIEPVPPPLASWLLEGKANLESRHLHEALAAYESALAIDGNSALAWTGKALALKQMGRYEEAGFAARCAQLGAAISRRRADGV